MIENGVVLPMFYLPPVKYFSTLKRYKDAILIEREEHFPKQTYRNRASIYSPDGLLVLTVPVVKGAKNHTKIKDVKISYDHEWQRLHWLTLQACYRRSAYFEFYEDELAPFYEKKFNYLFDYNEQLLRMLIKSVKLKVDLKFTENYEAFYPELDDFRNAINIKDEPLVEPKPYYQVFEERHGFQRDMSIVDLLFNQGPNAVNYL
jgi:hypothetical protein